MLYHKSAGTYRFNSLMKGLSNDNNYATKLNMTRLPYIVIGDGVAARTLLFYLSQYHSDIPLIQISKNDVFPSCSQTTTSVNCLRGTKPGMSKLGDLIVDSYHEFEKFYERFNPKGVSKTIEYQLWSPASEDKAKWQRRYPKVSGPINHIEGVGYFLSPMFVVENDAYVVSHQKYLDWLLPSKVDQIHDVVKNVDASEKGVKVVTLNGEYQGERCFICAGAFNKNFASLICDPKLRRMLEHSKPVAGTYAAIPVVKTKNRSLNLDQSFALALEGINFIYRQDRQEFLVGATTENNTHVYIPNQNLFAPIYNQLRDFLKPHIELPSFDQVDLYCGIREKGQKRLPFWGEIAPNTFMISGLYKNAFTFANLAAKQLIYYGSANNS